MSAFDPKRTSFAGQQSPPMYGDVDGKDPKAATLLKQMLSRGVSRYHPDPLAALKELRRQDYLNTPRQEGTVVV